MATLAANQKRRNDARVCCRSERFHKVIVDDSDKCFPAFIHCRFISFPSHCRPSAVDFSNKSVRSCWKIKAKVSGKHFQQTSKVSNAGRKAPAAVTQNDNSLRHVNKWVTHLPCSRICLNSLNGANHSELKQLWPFAKRIPAICFQVENISKAVRRENSKQASVSRVCS